MHNERIVITGIGALSPNGIGRENYFSAVAAGRSGVRPITQFDASTLPCRIAGEVDFDPTEWVDAKNIRHVSRVVPMAIAATSEALRDAKLDPTCGRSRDAPPDGRDARLGRRRRRVQRADVRALVQGRDEAGLDLFDSVRHDRHDRLRDLDGLRPPRLLASDLDGLHVVD